MKRAFLILFSVLVCFSVFAQDTPKPVAPYSPGRMTESGILFISGQIPVNPATGILVKGDIEAATRQAMENIGAILKTNGMDFANVVKCTVFLTDIRDYAAMNKIYATFFKDRFPAREAIEIVNLPLGADIEISAIAFK